MMLGLQLARAGIDVSVLEKHADFFRDFRGDTVHPSTLRILDDLGLLDEFLRLPHSEIREIGGRISGHEVRLASLAAVPGRCKFVAFMPQWDFLNFLAEKARRYPSFQLLMQTDAVDLIQRNGSVAGVVASTPSGTQEIEADLVVACDGRHSTLRERAGLRVIDIGAPIDVLWMRLSRKPGTVSEAFGNIGGGSILVAIDRMTYFQCAWVIPKGAFERIQAEGLERFRERIARAAPFLADSVAELTDWEQIKLLTVRIDRLARWHLPGLLCIGDAAHAMSPIGGVGINLAVQDAVAAANILAEPLRSGRVGEAVLAKVQARREFPTKATQALQVLLQDRFISRVLTSETTLRPPMLVRLLNALQPLRMLPGVLIGLGFRPERVQTMERAARPSG
jgi:2-polyprenyl-6-methoxyphenol hydroxylase-like FAD-dependent oxidoreductase